MNAPFGSIVVAAGINMRAFCCDLHFYFKTSNCWLGGQSTVKLQRQLLPSLVGSDWELFAMYRFCFCFCTCDERVCSSRSQTHIFAVVMQQQQRMVQVQLQDQLTCQVCSLLAAPCVYSAGDTLIRLKKASSSICCCSVGIVVAVIISRWRWWELSAVKCCVSSGTVWLFTEIITRWLHLSCVCQVFFFVDVDCALPFDTDDDDEKQMCNSRKLLHQMIAASQKGYYLDVNGGVT